MITYGSVCSGIEAATMAWHPLGWKPSFFSEIEPFARAVLTHHYPGTKCHGDFTTIKEGDYEPIDLLVGGTPCQAFSLAGLRGGLADARGNLALAYLQLVDRLRPRWMVWENVPGVLSSLSHDAPDPSQPPDDVDLVDGQEWVGEDEYDADESHAFSCFLAGVQELGYGLAYRVLDAQHFGVAQRRRRVFVVGHLGDWRPAAEVLLEPGSLRGDPAPSRGKGQGTSPTLAARARSGGGLGTDHDLDGGLIEDGSFSFDLSFVQRPTDGSDPRPGDPSYTVTKSSNLHVVQADAQHLAFNWQSGQGLSESADVTPTLVKNQVVSVFSEMPSGVRESSDVFQPLLTGGGVNGGQGGDWILESSLPDVAPSLLSLAGSRPGNAGLIDGGLLDDRPEAFTHNDYGVIGSGDVSASLTKIGQDSDRVIGVAHRGTVRRLTPVECARLQGFPDHFLDITYRGKPASDGPKYKALGNSMAVPVMAWIGRRIDAVHRRTAEAWKPAEQAPAPQPSVHPFQRRKASRTRQAPAADLLADDAPNPTET